MRSEISAAEAAQIYAISPSDFQLRLSRNGNHLPLILKSLDRVATGHLSSNELSVILGVSVRQCNALIKSWNVTRPAKCLPEYLVERTASKVKWEIRKKYAIDYIAGGASIADSAANAGVSTRQMRRWVSELLARHASKTHVVAFSDLRAISPTKRRRLADQVEVREGLDRDKQAAVREIVSGERLLRDVATERVLNNNIVKGRSGVA